MKTLVKSLALTWVATAVTLAGCKKQEAEASKEAAPVAEAAPASKPDPIAKELTRAKDIGVAMERAMAAAKEAEATGSTLCERAHLGLVRASQVLREDRPDVAAMPPKEAQFMDACRALPEPAQQCLVMSYSVDNVAECKKITRELPAEKREAIENAMRSGTEP